MKPILKWPGGKIKQLNTILPLIKPYLDGKNQFIEPFIGGGAVSFGLEYEKTVINDLNGELTNLYTCVRDNADLLITKLAELARFHSKGHYYAVRDWDKLPNFRDFDFRFSRAARTIYLNKTCFNGLYRVNSKGYFNVGLGRTSSGKQPTIIDDPALRALSEYLKQVTILNEDVFNLLESDIVKAGDVIYLDPPYDYEEEGFTGYQKEGWTKEDTKRLYKECERLRELGCKELYLVIIIHH